MIRWLRKVLRRRETGSCGRWSDWFAVVVCGAVFPLAGVLSCFGLLFFPCFCFCFCWLFFCSVLCVFFLVCCVVVPAVCGCVSWLLELASLSCWVWGAPLPCLGLFVLCPLGFLLFKKKKKKKIGAQLHKHRPEKQGAKSLLSANTTTNHKQTPQKNKIEQKNN